MLNRSMVEQIKCRWREFRREPSAFYWVVFMPVIWMLALGFAFSKPHPETYGVGWQAPAAKSAWSDSLREVLIKDSQIKVREGTNEELHTKMMRGEIALIVTSNQDKSASYTLDNHNPEAVRAQKHVDDLIQRSAGRKDLVTNDVDTIAVEGGRYVDFLIPGLLGLSIMTSSLFGVGMTIVSNRKENLLKRYLATPMRAYEYIVSHVLGRMMVLTAEFVAVMLTGFIIFHFKVYGNFLSFVFFSVLGAAAFTSLALLCASRTRSIPMISGLTNIISLPMMMLSGVFFSKNNFPDWLITATGFLPLTVLNDGLRRIAIEGQPLHTLGFEIAVLSFYLIIPAIVTQKIFKWY